jgi:hypothetical protein
MSKNLNSKLEKKKNFTCDPLRHGVEGSPGTMGRGLYGERPMNYMTYVNHLLSK